VAALAKIIGSVDDLGRPVIRVEVAGRDGFLAVVDTGFNRTLMLQHDQAVSLGFSFTGLNEYVELGTTSISKVQRATGQIDWLGKNVSVDAFVSMEPPVTHRPDTARALLGTELLADCLLLVDFTNKVVESETQD
jgi:predicted aspartyl protease